MNGADYNRGAMQDVSADWVKDDLGERFVKATLHFPDDYDGTVTATVVRNRERVSQPRGAVLYLHGFLDYFFQSHVADAFVAAGYDFYALDLRKYGRSMGSAEHPNFCKALEEYFPEMTAAIDIITRVEGHATVVLMAHSTGALPGLLYAQVGDRRASLTRMILNSPFLEMPKGSALGHVAAFIGWLNPFGPIRNPVNRWYGQSIHADYKGEWRFNTTWKPVERSVAYYGWVRAVVLVQDRIKKGLNLEVPILVLHSDRSLKGDSWSDRFHHADLVLDVEHIKQLAPRLGSRVLVKEIPGGKHDLTLSRQEPREQCLRTMLEWLQ